MSRVLDRLSQPLVACVSWCVVAALEEEPCFASTVSEDPETTLQGCISSSQIRKPRA